MKKQTFIQISLHKWGEYFFYLQVEDDTTPDEIKQRVAEVAKIKYSLPDTPTNFPFGKTDKQDDPRLTGLSEIDVWVVQPVLETPASPHKQLAGKPYAEIQDMAKKVMAELCDTSYQNHTFPLGSGKKAYTVTTIIPELQNLTEDGLIFLNDWLTNIADTNAFHA